MSYPQSTTSGSVGGLMPPVKAKVKSKPKATPHLMQKKVK
jgi:hypothetical protein